ncbi:hypothetical protein [Ensifer adhaerens]|uniref:hypothetical protein n=1 Tax=Ensifer adhaerens TaxID=106592 RepID=UPI000CF1966C|nr:hypothetical protein [Ensifer adhaerens]
MITEEAIEAFALAFWPVNAVSKMESCGGDIAKALEAALSTLPIAGEGKALDEEQIAKLIWQHLPSKVAEEMTRDKHPPLFPQAEYTVATLSAKNFVEAIIDLVTPSSPGKDGGQEVEAVAALEYKLKAATSALEKICDTRCPHDMGFDREIGPLGCSLGDKCVCVGLCTIASRALQEITTKALEGQEFQAVAWRWKWKDCGSWIVTEGEPDANERRIIEPLYKSAHVAEPVDYHIVFDGFPSPDGPRFIEVENAAGQSINAGEWRKRDDGLCELVIKAGAHAHG